MGISKSQDNTSHTLGWLLAKNKIKKITRWQGCEEIGNVVQCWKCKMVSLVMAVPQKIKNGNIP